MAGCSSSTKQVVVGIFLGAIFMVLLNANMLVLAITKIACGVSITEIEVSSDRSMVEPSLKGTKIELHQVVEVTDQYYLKMKDDPRLQLSQQIQKSLVTRKDHTTTKFHRKMRYNANQDSYAACVLSDNFAFQHVWGNGGTTVVPVAERQLGEVQHKKNHPDMQNKKWIALVQDPIRHFLWGFAMSELKLADITAERDPDMAAKLVQSWKDPNLTYDKRVGQFLHRMKNYAAQSTTAEISPLMHALPQSNFLFNDEGVVHPNIVAVGHNDEWQAMMELAEFSGNLAGTRPEPESPLIAEYFPQDISHLSDKTIRRLCEFLAVDYFLFGLDAPSVCQRSMGSLFKF